MDKNPTNNALVKRMVTWALKEFNSSKSKSDIRMLGLWKLLVSAIEKWNKNEKYHLPLGFKFKQRF